MNLEEVISSAKNNAPQPDEALRKTIFKAVVVGDNASCFECRQKGPTWMSTTFAIYLCINCSGKHRSYGSHLSKVKSTGMDKLGWDTIARVLLGGNKKLSDFLNQNSVSQLDVKSAVAKKYTQNLDQLVDEVLSLQHSATMIKHTVHGSESVTVAAASAKAPHLPASKSEIIRFSEEEMAPIEKKTDVDFDDDFSDFGSDDCVPVAKPDLFKPQKFEYKYSEEPITRDLTSVESSANNNNFQQPKAYVDSNAKYSSIGSDSIGGQGYAPEAPSNNSYLPNDLEQYIQLNMTANDLIDMKFANFSNQARETAKDLAGDCEQFAKKAYSWAEKFLGPT